MTAVIETEHLTKQFKNIVAVNDLNLSIDEGDTFGFLGPNGAGKTTTIRMLTGFLKPNAGTVRLLGHDIFKDGKKAKERIGLVPDMYGLYEVLNAEEHLQYYGALYGMDKSERERQIDKVLPLVGLDDRRTSKIREYSHGMKQRLVIAQALLNEPKLLFLDEPTIGLDPKGAFEVRNIIKDLAKKGMTIFMSSHLLNEVQDVCKTVGIINFGVLQKLDSIQNLSRNLQFQKGNFVNIVLTNMDNRFISLLETQEGVIKVYPNQNAVKVKVRNTDILPHMVEKIVKAGGKIRSVTEIKPDLEQIFLELTER